MKFTPPISFTRFLSRHSVLGVVLIISALSILAMKGARPASGQTNNNQVTTVSAAGFTPQLAPDSIAAGFGVKLATRLELATSQPLPTQLAGTTVRVNGQLAPLFFVSPNQVNYLIPPGIPVGAASVVVTSGDGTVSQGTVQIATAAPALFAANANGLGPLASLLLRVKANGQFIFEALSQYSEDEKKFVTKAIDFGEASDQLFLVLYLTGIRQAPPSSVRVNIGGVEYAPSGIAPVQGFTGLDQINIPLPRTFGGRGSIKLLVKAAGSGSSNDGEFEISAGASGAALQIARVPSSPVLVGEEIEIGGSGFAANPLENTVLIVADDGVTTKADVLGVAGDSLRVRVPFGAGAGQLRVSRGQSEASARIQVRTSVSGFVQEFRDGARVAVVGLPIALREPSGRRIETATDANGSFVLRDAVATPLSIIDIAGQAASGINYPAQTRKLTVRANRDNQYKGDGDLANIIELKRNGAAASSLLTENTPTNEILMTSEPEDTIKSGPVTFETNNSTITFPGGGSGQLGLTVLDPGRTPANLPVFHFSSTIAQITPFGARLNPGGKLTFPNSDAIPAGANARLFKFDQQNNSATLGQFIDVGEATVSADGQRVETAPNAITETSYYFVSIPRPLAAINGRVLESDGRPAPRAVVQARGQSAFTDGFGGFVLRNVPVLKASGDRVKVEVSYQRPDGTISRKESSEVELTVNQLATVKPEIALDPVLKNFPPVILAPSSLTVTAGETRDFDFIAADPDSARPPQVSVSGNATAFTVLSNHGNGLYRLRLTPGANAAGNYSLMLSASDDANRSVQNIAITVAQPDNSKPTAQSQSVTTAEDTPKQITLTGRDPGGRTLNYLIVNQPSRGSLSGGAPTLTYTPARDFNGVESFTFKVSNGSAESQIATVFVAVTPVNDAPVLSVVGGQVVNAGDTLNIVATATDVDGEQTLRFTATGLPPGATFTEVGGTSRQLSWTPTFTQIGNYAVRITVLDNGQPVLSNSGIINITSSAKWGKTSGPGGGKITALLSDGRNIFAGTAGGGAFISTDNGLSWATINDGLSGFDAASASITSFAIKGSDLFVSVFGSGIFRSSNDGQNWTSVNIGLTEKRINALAVSGNFLFAGTAAGIFRSSDNGGTWSAANNGLTNRTTNAFAVQGDAIFAGTAGGVFRSTDNGGDWTALNNGLTTLSVRAILVSGTTLLVGTFGGGVFRSTNSGQNWAAANAGITSRYVFMFAVNGNTFFAGAGGNTFGLGVGGGIFRSTDQGQNWIPVSAGLSEDPFISSLIIHREAFFAGVNNQEDRQGSGIFRSINNAQSWEATNNGLTNTIVRQIAPFGAALFAGTVGDGVFRSTDKGQSWVAVNKGLPSNGVVDSFAIRGNQLITCVNGEVYLTNDQGQSWIPLINGLIGVTVRSLAVSGNNLFAGTKSNLLGDGDGVFRSTDNGQSWTQVNNGIPRKGVNSLAVIGDNVFASSNTAIYLTMNQGQSWVTVSNPTTATFAQTIYAGKDALFAITDNGLFRSVNNGQSWVFIYSGLPNTKVSSFLASEGMLFIGTRDGVLFSTDNGQSLTAISDSLTNRSVSSLAVSEDGLFAGTDIQINGSGTGSGVFRLSRAAQSWIENNSGLTNKSVNTVAANNLALFAGTLGSGVFRSINQGQRWSSSNIGLPQNSNIQSIISNGSTLWAALFGEGVYRSINNGDSWTAANSGLANKFVNKLFLNGSALYAGTDGGVFRSLDGGNNWAAINTNLSNLRVVSFTSNAGVIYVGTDGGGVFRLNPDGVSWMRVSTGLTSLSVTALGVSNGVLYAGTSGGGICISRDGRDTWTAMNNQIPSNLNVYAFAVSGKKVYAGSIYGVFVTEDEGKTWKQINAGLLDVYVTGLIVSGDQLFAGTARGGVFSSQIPQQ